MEKFEEWAKYAEEDRQIAELAIQENGPPNQICFHAQQLAEKYLKGFLVFSGERFEKVHHLDYLLHLCEKIDADFTALTEDVKYLTDFYTETRYPGDVPEFSFSECRKALEAALRIREFVKSKVESLVIP